MFTTNHFIWLGACVLAIVIGAILAIRLKLKERAACLVMFAICLFSEISKMCVNLVESESGGFVLSPKALPFHLCSLLLFAVGAFVFLKDGPFREKLKSLFTPLALGGGVMAMLIPTNGVDFLDIEAYQCFLYHAGLVWLAVYFIGTKQADLGWKSYVRNLGLMSLLLLGSIYVNSILSVYDTNFLYTRKPPMDGLPLLNLDKGWIIYILVLIAAGIVLISLIQLPFILRERTKRKEGNEGG